MRLKAPYSWLVLLMHLHACSSSSQTRTKPGPVTTPPPTGPQASRCIANTVDDATSTAPGADNTCPDGTVAANIYAPNLDPTSGPTRCFDTNKAPPVPTAGTCPSGYTISTYVSTPVAGADPGYLCIGENFYTGDRVSLGRPSGFCLPGSDGACSTSFVKVKSIDPPSDDGCFMSVDHTV